jgi:flagellar motor switch protein FliM
VSRDKSNAERTMMIEVAKLRPSGAEASSQEASSHSVRRKTSRRREWNPLVFEGLEKVSKAHVRLVRNLEWMLPNVRLVGEVSETVQKRLTEMLDEPVSLSVEFIHLIHPSKLIRYISEPTFLGVLAPIPNKSRGLLEVDIALAHWAIDTLLGGTGEAVGLRPLTDIEEGVMTFVVLETLKTLAPSLDSSLPKLRLETIAPTLNDAGALLSEEESLAMVQLKAVFGGHTGFVRLFIPEGVLALAEPPFDAPVRRVRRIADAQSHGARLGNVSAWLRAEIGHVEVTAGDLAQLRERDVVLVDGLTARPDKGEGGTVKLKLGLARAGYIAGELVLQNQAFVAKVTEVVVGAPAPPASEGDGAAGAEDAARAGRANMQEGQAEGADLLNDIPLQVAVEIGRLPITAEEVVGLKVGHVFDLNRQVGEPLDLSVNGKIVARGELVEVEGNLGIRIVSLAG